MGKFSENLDASFKKKNIPLEIRKENDLNLIKDFLGEINNKENRYIFYCPDLTFPLQSLRTIYQTVSKLKELGFKSYVLHENKGFKADWLREEYNVDILYVNTDTKKKSYSFPFKPNDTFIVPDGFIGIMESVYNNVAITKIVYLMSYEGIAVIKQHDWSSLGFNKVISVSQELIDDYRAIYPQLDYYYLPFYVNTQNIKSREDVENLKPIITLFSRNKKEASQLINIFYNKYGFLNVFDFRVIRTLDSDAYYKAISESCLMVVIDGESGCMVPPLEASYFGLPVIMYENRSVRHLDFYTDKITKVPKDIFFIAEEIAGFCLAYLEKSNIGSYIPIENKEYSIKNFNKKILLFEDLQQQLELRFNNVLKAKENENK
jgi:hypothetical protein